MTTRTFNLLLVAALAIGLLALARFAPRASAAEPDRRSGWRIQICEPGRPCELRGKVLGGTACSVDLATVRWVVADRSTLACVRVVDGRAARR